MPAYAPTDVLETHEVTNQPPPFAGQNLYLIDQPLREAVRREAGPWLDDRMTALGAVVGSEHVLELGELANRHPPELVAFDRYGRRLDEARFHPAYHELMTLAMDHGVHDVAWTVDEPGAHVGHLGLLALFTQAEAGTMCPINMTYAAAPVLAAHRDVKLGGRVGAFGDVEQQAHDPLLGRAAAQHQDVVLAALQVLGGQAEKGPGRVAAPGGQLAERAATDHADAGVGHGLGRDPMGLAHLQAEIVAGEVERVDLPAAVAQDAIGPHRARHHLIDVRGFLALAEDLFVAGEVEAGAGDGQDGVQGERRGVDAKRRQHGKTLLLLRSLRLSLRGDHSGAAPKETPLRGFAGAPCF